MGARRFLTLTFAVALVGAQVTAASGTAASATAAQASPDPNYTGTPLPIPTDAYPPPTPSLWWVVAGFTILLVGLGVLIVTRRRS